MRASLRLPARKLAMSFLALVVAAPVRARNAAERRVLDYVNAHLQPGQPLIVSDLYNKVFTSPEDRQALNKLYNAFFRIPLFVAGYQERYHRPPRLKTIAEQFDLDSPGAADILLRVMEADPRVPRFITRNPRTHEISRVDADAVRNDPQFGRIIRRQLGGWEGQAAPPFDLTTLGGQDVRSQDLSGKVVLLYVWFTGCPPCMKQAPELAALDREFAPRSLSVVGANADKLLGLGYSDEDRARYIQKEKISFPVVHWTKASDGAYGGIAIFPTLFLINRGGTVVGHWVGYTPPSDLRQAISAALAENR